jgi:hypothetical protein
MQSKEHDMTQEKSPKTQAKDDAADIGLLGITNVPVDRFHYRDFRYSNLNDAVAQAKRDIAAGE